jgi:hypothetical protein
MIVEFEDRLSKANQLFEGVYKRTGSAKKINADLLPVGHFLSKIPRFFVPALGGWINDPTFVEKNEQLKENDIIIGYDDRSKTGMSIKFKIRSPVQKIKQSRDNRLIEKGSICSTKSKEYLRALATKLDISEDDTLNVDTLCAKIRSKLIYFELKERIKKSKIKYFYFVYENHT